MTALFDAVFAVFVVAMLAVAFLIVRSALRRDRQERAARPADQPRGGGPSAGKHQVR